MTTRPDEVATAAPRTALVVGASGSIGNALADRLQSEGAFTRVIRLSRRNDGLNLEDEDSVKAAAAGLLDEGVQLERLIVATGILHDGGATPERSLGEIDGAAMSRLLAVNAVGPALVLKYFWPLLPLRGRSVFAALSAKVGSIGDNSLGGWYSYRASKAALNQIVRTAAVELRRRRPEAVCVAIHPGTVASPLSDPFAKRGLNVVSPDVAAAAVLRTLEGLTTADSGGFFHADGHRLPW